MSTHQTKEEIEDELKIIQEARNDPARFAPLYDKYYRPIFLFIHRRTDQEDLTADICSQVFLKAILHLPKYTFKGVPFSAWLYRIALNEINQYFRSHKNRRSVSIEDAGIVKLTQGISGNDDDIAAKEKILMEGIKKLSKEEIQYIELRFFEDRSFKEIGFLMNITENNAKVRTY